MNPTPQFPALVIHHRVRLLIVFTEEMESLLTWISSTLYHRKDINEFCPGIANPCIKLILILHSILYFVFYNPLK